MPGGYTPNSKMDMRHRKKIYERGRVIAERDPYEARERRELKELERLKGIYEAQSNELTDKDREADEAYKRLLSVKAKLEG